MFIPCKEDFPHPSCTAWDCFICCKYYFLVHSTATEPLNLLVSNNRSGASAYLPCRPYHFWFVLIVSWITLQIVYYSLNTSQIPVTSFVLEALQVASLAFEGVLWCTVPCDEGYQDLVLSLYTHTFIHIFIYIRHTYICLGLLGWVL